MTAVKQKYWSGENGGDAGGQNDPPSDDRMDVSEPTLSDKELDSPDTDAEGADLGSPLAAAASSSSSSTEKDVNSISSDKNGTLDNQDHNIDNRERSVDNRDKIAENWDSNVDNRTSNDLPQMSPINRSQSTSGVNFGVLDLELPSSGSYQAETVDFPSSPKQMKLLTQKSYEAQGLAMPREEFDNAGTMEDGDDDDDPSTYRAILSPGLGDVRLKKAPAVSVHITDSGSSETKDGKKEASDAESDLEDYYEDYHMPLTHQNVMSRQKSFRRKLEQTPMNMPDADRIENIVKSGELHRHGSIRRKIVPYLSDVEHYVVKEDPLEEEVSGTQDGSESTGGNDSEAVMEHIERFENLLHGEMHRVLRQHSNQMMTSTPEKERFADDEPAVSPILQGREKNESDFEGDSSMSFENVFIDQNTVDKIKECFDKQKYKDNYTLSGHLQDILTPAEIDEIVNNSKAYSSFIDEEVIKALFWSYSSTESASNTPKEPTAPSQVPPELKRKISANGALNESFRQFLEEQGTITAVFDDVSRATLRRNQTKLQELKEVLPNNFRLECRNSFRKHKGSQDIIVEGLFVESNNLSSTLQKKLSVSTFDLDEDSGTSNNESESRHASQFETSEESGISSANQQSLEGEGEKTTQQPLSLSPGVILDVHKLQSTTRVETPSKERTVETNGRLGATEFTDVNTRINRVCQNGSSWPVSKAVPERPSSLGQQRKKKILVSEDILSAPDVDEDTQSLPGRHSPVDERTVDGETTDLTFDDEDVGILTPDIDTPDEMEESIAERLGSLAHPEPIPEYTAAEEFAEERSWRKCVISGIERRIDMKVIEPYKKVLSHGGYLGDGGHNAIIVFSACFLPDRSRRDYDYVMDNLFLYVLTTLDQLVAEDYVLIYLHGATLGRCMPTFGWLKRCYQMIDRRLRKNLKGLYLVHPTFWLKTIVLMTRPFISSKFSRKLRFVNNLDELSQLIPMDQVCIPDRVKQYDEIRQALEASK